MLEYLPYEEGIKTGGLVSSSHFWMRLEYLPYEEGIKTIIND